MRSNLKFNRSPLKIQGFNTKNHVFQGVVWPVKGSTGNDYDVEMHENGFSCTCTGFTMHGKCKHITSVYNRIMDENYSVYKWSSQ